MRIFKFFAGLVAVLAAIALSSCSGGPRTVEYPVINFSNTSSIDIVKVELTDSATIIDMDAHYRPGWWIRIASDSYLKAGGKDYALTGWEGIEPDSEFWMPESGEASFKLIFEPLPFSTKEFDFIEGDSQGAFLLLGVDISGKPQGKYPKGLPKELQKEVADAEVPEPAFEMGRTTVNVHLLPYIKELASVNMYVNSMDDSQEEYTMKFDSTGVATVSFDQYGTANAFLTGSGDYIYGSFTLYPGETLDYYVDMRRTGKIAMEHRVEELKGADAFNAHNGRYANYDFVINEYKGGPYYGLQLYTGKFGDYRMSGEEYKNMVKGQYLAFADSIAALDIPDAAKEYKLLRLQDDVMEAMANYKILLGRNYMFSKDDWRSGAPIDSIPAALTDEDYAEMATWFDAGNPKLLLVGTATNLIDWNARAGVPGDLSKAMRNYAAAARVAREERTNMEYLDTLRTVSNPFFAEAVDSLAARTGRKMAALKAKGMALPTPEGADDKVFDAIIAPHKGKVVVVDLWNTWCGPCRGALKANEPLKTGELADEDIVWIYIADESSDAVKYLEMIPEIKGLHYKVSDSQISAIRKRFDVDGIPYYILVDREGKAEGRPDLRDHSKYISEIKSKL
ncbi:MAG: TlpA family protein disulfide reductase [Clostridium sp.]|nr:TlpA family protein disulfide reductase [Clostridium sp.]